MRMMLAAVLVGAAAGLPGCIFVSSNRAVESPRALVQQTREVEPGSGPPTFRSEHREQLARVTPGMSVEGLRALFPEAVFVERKHEEGRALDVYSVAMSVAYHYRDGRVVYTADEEGRFYFYEGKLERWKEGR